MPSDAAMRTHSLRCSHVRVLFAERRRCASRAWPNQPIRIVVPFAPGGASDILARLIAKELAERVKQPVVVENKPGAGGTIGADFVAKSPPDGYTLLLADSSVVMTFPSLYPNLPYAAKDLIPVANIATFGLILIAPASSQVQLARRSDRRRQGVARQAQHGLARQRLVESPDARAASTPSPGRRSCTSPTRAPGPRSTTSSAARSISRSRAAPRRSRCSTAARPRRSP